MPHMMYTCEHALLALVALGLMAALAALWASSQVRLKPLDNQGLIGIAYSDPKTGIFLGSPSILRLPDESLLASHDTFRGWGDGRRKAPDTYVYRSKDQGVSWRSAGVARGQYWSGLFQVPGCSGSVYLMGTTQSSKGGAIAISRSSDGGATWQRSILFSPPPDCGYHTSSVPVAFANGTVFRGFELFCGNYSWPAMFQATVIWADSYRERDLLDPAAWQMAAPVTFNGSFIPAFMPPNITAGGYLEGNAVLSPQGNIALLLRTRFYDIDGSLRSLGYATMLRLVRNESAEGMCLQFEGVVAMPGGGNKFSIRYDRRTRLYLALSNPGVEKLGDTWVPDARNRLALIYSSNLRNWKFATWVLQPNDGLSKEDSLNQTGYMYADWQITGRDVIASIRTAYAGADSFHNTNWLAFKRIENFRQYLPALAAR